MVSDASGRDLLVFAPDAGGPWPVIVAFHGIDGTAHDMAELSTRLAREGAVVFAVNYRSDLSTLAGVRHAAIDSECGYRFARRLAADYGGDLAQPVTFVGWSLGASAALGVGLTEDLDPEGAFISCFGPVPRPDIIVGISGCHYEGGDLDLVDTQGWQNTEAEILLLGGRADTNCPPWETTKAAAEMRAAAYDVQLLMLEGADHFGPIFHRFVDGEMVLEPDAPAGARVVDLVMGAIAERQGRT